MAVKTKNGQREFFIHGETDVLRARREGVRMARDIGFKELEQAEIEIVLSELGVNIVRHAGSRGVLILTPLETEAEDGLEIIAKNTVSMVVFSDGISDKFELNRDMLRKSAQEITHHIMGTMEESTTMPRFLS